MPPSLRFRPALVSSVAAAAALSLAACGSSAPSSSGLSSGTSAATGTPIKIAVVAPLSSPAFSVPQVLAGANAAASSINADGGVDGHPIEIVSCNDQFNPNQAAKCVQTAVSQDVTALTGVFLFGPQIFEATKAAGIPVLDTQPLSPDAGSSSNSFPLNAGGFSQFVGIGRHLADKGDKNVVIMPSDNTAAAEFNATFAEQGVEAGGGTVVRSVTVAAGAPDFSAYVQQALEGGNTDGIIYVGAPEDFPKLVLAAKQAGFTGDIGAVIGHVPPATVEVLASSGVNVLVASNYIVPPAEEAAPFAADMAEYEPEAVVDVFCEGAWAAVNAVAAALEGAAGTDAASLTAALSGASSLSVGEMMPSIDLTKAGPLPDYPRLTNTGVVVMDVSNGSYEPTGPFFDPFAG